MPTIRKSANTTGSGGKPALGRYRKFEAVSTSGRSGSIVPIPIVANQSSRTAKLTLPRAPRRWSPFCTANVVQPLD